MLKKIGHIITGWGKAMGLIPISKAEEKLAELRLRICKGCKHSQMKKWVDMLNEQADDYGQVTGLVCTICKCPCPEKSLVVDEECPKNFW